MRAMKDSGIPWIGEIPEGWHTCQVKNIFTIARGRVIPITEMDDSYHYPVYSSQTKDNGCMGYIPTFDYEGEALTWTTDGANAGTVFYRVGKFNCTNICGVLQLKTRTSFITYMLYSVGHSAFHCRRADTNGYKIMSNEMAEIKIAVPPLVEQQRIAEFLDRKCAEVDEMIALQEQIIEELKAYKQSVITEAVTKGLNPAAPMRDSGIEWIDSIPEHWEVCKLKRKYRLLNGRAYSDNELLFEGRYRILRVGNLFTSNHWYYSDLELEDNKYCEKGDLLYGWSASIGPYMWEEEKVIYHYHIWKVLFAPNSRRYVYYQLQALTDAKKKDMHGTAMQHLTMDNMNNSYIATAPLSEQQTIADYLDDKCADIDSLIQTKQSKIDSLKEYKKSIIYEYVTGKREVE